MPIRGKDPNFNGFGAQLHYHHHHHQLLEPAQIQFTSSAESRNGVRKEHQETIFLSLFGSKGGFDKVCGGTGVFHPRVSKSSTTTTSTTLLEANKRQGLRSNELEDWT